MLAVLFLPNSFYFPPALVSVLLSILPPHPVILVLVGSVASSLGNILALPHLWDTKQWACPCPLYSGKGDWPHAARIIIVSITINELN